MKLFNTSFGAQKEETGISAAMTSLGRALQGDQILSSQLTKSAFAMEGLVSDQSQHEMTQALDKLSLAVESIADMLGDKASFTNAQKSACAAAGVMAGDAESSLRFSAPSAISKEGFTYIANTGAEDTSSKRSLAFETYDPRNNRDVASSSMIYNLQSARQDVFGETLFPTITVSPEQSGLSVTARINSVLGDIKRNTNGTVTPFVKQNIIRALADATILKNDSTRITPVVRANSAQYFVNPAIVAPADLLVEGEAITTAPLAVGKRLGLLEVSQTDTLLANGVMDITDTIEGAVSLTNLYMTVATPAVAAAAAIGVFGQPGYVPAVVAAPAATDVVRLNVQNLPFSNFTGSVQDNISKFTLAFDTKSVLIDLNTKQNDGSALVALAPIVAGSYQVRLGVVMTGDINIELGGTAVYFNALEVVSVHDQAGNNLSLTVGTGKQIADLFVAAKIEGYDLLAYRSNLNRRERGQLIDTTFVTQQYRINLRSPITALRPVSSDNTDNSDALSALIVATHIRTSNAAVTELLRAATLLSQYVAQALPGVAGPDVLGVGRHLVIPTYRSYVFNAQVEVASLNSSQVATDLQNALVNRIRDMAYGMYRDSQYQAASASQNGGLAKIPTVIIATDPVTSRYLTINADFNTLGNEFDIRLVNTTDIRVSGKIFITFGDFSGNNVDAPNPLHFGNMAWKPEMTVALDISRGGQTSKELTVQPAFLHFVNCPIMGVIDVQNLPAVFTKVAINFHAV